jgi:uncharacterized delta-60 repeat protein
MSNNIYKHLLLTLTAMLLYHLKLSAQLPECLDSGFANNGVLEINTGAAYELATALDYQSDGSIIVAGQAGAYLEPRFFIQRYHADGTVDFQFGEQEGYTALDDPNERILDDVLVLPNDEILVSYAGTLGHTDEGHFIYKFTPDGIMDATFGQNGIYKITPGDSVNLAGWSSTHLAALPAGKFIAAGNYADKIFIARFNADCSTDLTFGTGGIVEHEPDGLVNFHLATLIVDATGNIWMGGHDPNDGLLFKFLPDGSPDNSFGNNGKLVQDFSSSLDTRLRDFEILNDGSVITVSTVVPFNQIQLFINKYQPNGTPDGGFGTGGSTLETFTSVEGEVNDLQMLPNGNLLTSGRLNKVMVIMQHNTVGQKVTDFGADGIRAFWFSDLGDNEIIRLSLHPLNGKYYALGYTVSSYPFNTSYTDADIAWLRFHDDISDDNTFGVAGKMVGFVSKPDETAQGFYRQDDGKIIVATSEVGTVLTRYFPNGDIDRDFGNFGKITLRDIHVSGENCIKIHGERINVGGTSIYAAVYQLDADGLPDYFFGTNGRKVLSASHNFEEGVAVEIQNGKILLAGATHSFPNNTTNFRVARFDLNGALDPTFGTNGIANVPVGNDADAAFLIKVRENGKIVLIGQSKVNGTYYASFAQLDTNGAFDNGFGANGRFITNATNLYARPSSAALLPDDKILITSDIGNLLALQITENGTLDSSFSQDGFINTNSASEPFAILPQTLAMLGNQAYFGGQMNLDRLMLIRADENGGLSNPCTGQNPSWHFDLFPGFDEDIYAMLADSDTSLLVIGNKDPFSLNENNKDPFLVRFIPDHPTTQVYDLSRGNNLLRLRVAPNPATEAFSVEIPTDMPADCRLRLNDVAGKMYKLIPVNAAGGWLKVKREGLSDGMYFMQLSTADSRILGAGKVLLTK